MVLWIWYVIKRGRGGGGGAEEGRGGEGQEGIVSQGKPSFSWFGYDAEEEIYLLVSDQ